MQTTFSHCRAQEVCLFIAEGRGMALLRKLIEWSLRLILSAWNVRPGQNTLGCGWGQDQRSKCNRGSILKLQVLCHFHRLTWSDTWTRWRTRWSRRCVWRPGTRCAAPEPTWRPECVCWSVRSLCHPSTSRRRQRPVRVSFAAGPPPCLRSVIDQLFQQASVCSWVKGVTCSTLVTQKCKTFTVGSVGAAEIFRAKFAKRTSTFSFVGKTQQTQPRSFSTFCVIVCKFQKTIWAASKLWLAPRE